MHIGLIGGIGPAATEFYYRGLIDRHARSNTALDLTIAHADVREMARNLANRDAQKQADAFAPLLASTSDAAVIVVDERDVDKAEEIYSAFFGADTTPLTGGIPEETEE